MNSTRPKKSSIPSLKEYDRLLDEYESNEFGPASSQSDEDYLSQFKDL